MFDYLRLQLEDQCPAIGSGARSVLVIHSGPKWVRILDPSSCASAMLQRERHFVGKVLAPGFDGLARYGVPLDYEPAKMAKRLKRNAKLYKADTQYLRDAIAELNGA